MYKKILLTTLAVVIILAGVTGAVGYIWQKNMAPDTAFKTQPIKLPPIPENLKQAPSNELIPPLPKIPEPSVINSYTGEIIELESDKLVISTNHGDKTVKFNAGTIFEKIFVPRFPALPPLPGSNQAPAAEIPAAELISIAELQSGQNAQAFANENISGQSEFTANKISLVIRLDN
ncbi:hypothetical protein HN670_01110 [bacterium]|jgi:hypothetical protein|nr:hypothetical protein [bacterium]